MDDYPKFERRENENVTMLTRELDEFGEWQITRTYLSEATSKRALEELEIAVNKRNT
jgi:hypothetical protein